MFNVEELTLPWWFQVEWHPNVSWWDTSFFIGAISTFDPLNHSKSQCLLFKSSIVETLGFTMIYYDLNPNPSNFCGLHIRIDRYCQPTMHVDRFRTGNPRSSISMFVERYHPVCPVCPASPNSFRWWNPKISQVFAGKSMKSHSDTTAYPLVIQQFSTEDHHVNREFREKNTGHG